MTYTPETLRKMADMEEPLDDVEWFDATLAGCAATWKKDRKRRRAAEARFVRLVYAFNDCIALRRWDNGFEDYADVAELKAALAGEET